MPRKLPVFDRDVSKLQTFVLFAGHPRSGATLVNACLEAHPNCMMGNEINMLGDNRMNRITTRQQVLNRVSITAANFASSNWNWNGQSLHIPGQGEYGEVQIVGDKKSGITAKKSDNVKRYQWLSGLVGLPIQTISVVRDPFDNIASATIRSRTLERNTRFYYERCEGIQRLLDAKLPVHFIYLHKICSDPRAELRGLCDYLGIPYLNDWADNCAEVVWPEPRVTRDQIEWNTQTEAKVKKMIKRYEWLAPFRP